MKGRRQFLKIFFGLILTLVTINFYKIGNSMNSLPYHHLPDGSFRNLPGGPKRTKFKGNKNFLRFLYKGLIQRKMLSEDYIMIHFLKKKN